MLQVKDLTFGYGDKPLYGGANFVVGKNQKVGLVGPNGSGKSTLLSIILGKEEAYRGKVISRGVFSLVPQEVKNDPVMDNSESVRKYVNPGGEHNDFEINKMLSGLEINLDLDSSPKKLSGGQKTKLALARALLEKPDLLLLDEPTNFMDKSGKDWVMKFLSEYQKALIVISHDLELMDNAIDKVLVISPHNSKIEEYKGTYSDYVRLKKEHDEKVRRELVIKSRHLKKAEDRYQHMRADEKKSILRRKIEKERLTLPEVPPEIRKIKILIPEPKRVGEIPIKAKEIYKSYGDLNVLTGISISIIRGERVVFIGPNGSGKSTFIKILMDMVTPDSGEVIKDENLKVGYYSQEFETFDFDKTVIDTFCNKTNRDENFARSFLGRFLFNREKVFQSVRSLSGGEKTRLSIAILTAGENNLLILDEPTTYLDVMSQRIILESLKQYKGTMIFVSHTPEFVRELNPTRAIVFPEQKIVLWDDEVLNKVDEV